VVSFYYGSSQGPPQDEKPGGFRETVAIIWAAFSVLAVPLGIIFGIFVAVAVLIGLFAWNAIAGGVAVLAVILGVAGYGVWEARHPPKFG
jgi:uncharacterized membrane-anchored protein